MRKRCDQVGPQKAGINMNTVRCNTLSYHQMPLSHTHLAFNGLNKQTNKQKCAKRPVYFVCVGFRINCTHWGIFMQNSCHSIYPVPLINWFSLGLCLKNLHVRCVCTPWRAIFTSCMFTERPPWWLTFLILSSSISATSDCNDHQSSSSPSLILFSIMHEAAAHLIVLLHYWHYTASATP